MIWKLICMCTRVGDRSCYQSHLSGCHGADAQFPRAPSACRRRPLLWPHASRTCIPWLFRSFTSGISSNALNGFREIIRVSARPRPEPPAASEGWSSRFRARSKVTPYTPSAHAARAMLPRPEPIDATPAFPMPRCTSIKQPGAAARLIADCPGGCGTALCQHHKLYRSYNSATEGVNARITLQHGR